MMKQVLVIRTQFPGHSGVRKGKMIAQGAHASVTAAFEGISHSLTRSHVEQWLHQGQTKIAVYVKSEEELLDIYNKAKSGKLACALIRDAGKTEFDGVPTLTAVAVGPAPVELVDAITRHLPLL
ncbi:MAG: aminoacyl-tRNA hydrolase [Brevinema sp.]